MTEEDLRKQAWDYFQMHATQRLTTFNFYVGISSLLVGGLAATIKAESEIPLLGGVVGILLILFSIVFWKIDQRNSDLIKRAERALMSFEAKSSFPDQNGKPHDAKLFTREDSDTNEKKQNRTWCVLQNHYSYSECFRAVFMIFGGLGTAGICYAAIRHWPW
jgi:hypothetical protein